MVPVKSDRGSAPTGTHLNTQIKLRRHTRFFDEVSNTRTNTQTNTHTPTHKNISTCVKIEDSDDEVVQDNAQKYMRDNEIVKLKKIKKLKSTSIKKEVTKRNQLAKRFANSLADNEILFVEDAGYIKIEDDDDIKSYQIKQEDIVRETDLGTAQKVLDLSLPGGPYKLSYTQSGRHLLIGGRKGALSVVDCHTFEPKCEINVSEKIRDVTFLHNYTMWAAAQDKYVYIYDQQGVELHCIRDTLFTNAMDFLPYHFLLVSIGEFGIIRYLDVSTGLNVAAHRTGRGASSVLRHNPANAVVHVGSNRGVVSLWTPNMGKPIVEMLCHKGAISTLAISDPYMVTAGADGEWKIWDMRTYTKLHTHLYTGAPPSEMRFSGTGLLGIANGPRVEIWKDVCASSKIKTPYLTHMAEGRIISSLNFQPFEDVCAIGHTHGLNTLLIPGAGLANFDSYEANPYQTKKQRQEQEVQQLLEKLQPETIMLDQTRIGSIDTASKAVIVQETLEAEAAKAAKKKKKKRTRKRGRSSAANRQKSKQKQYGEKVREAAAKRIKEEKTKKSIKKEEPTKPQTQIRVKTEKPVVLRKALDRFRT